MGIMHPSWEGKSCRGILFPVGALGIGVFYNYYWQQTMNAPFNVPLFSWYYEYTGDLNFYGIGRILIFVFVAIFMKTICRRRHTANHIVIP